MEFKELYGVYKVSKCGIVLGRRGNPLSPTNNGRGYPVVKVKIADKWTCKAVHRMVAEAWLPNPDNLPEVNHKDCNRLNWNVDNLEWCTHSYNVEYSYKTEGRTATGESNSRCKTTSEEVHEICKLLADGNSAACIRDCGYDYGVVRAIKARKNWTHISESYVW